VYGVGHSKCPTRGVEGPDLPPVVADINGSVPLDSAADDPEGLVWFQQLDPRPLAVSLRHRETAGRGDKLWLVK
jgi:hypothetical protein